MEREDDEGLSFYVEDVIDQDVPSSIPPSDDLAPPTGVVKVYLASLRDQLGREMQDGQWPKCYLQGQWWIHPPHPYFAMQKALDRPSGLNPSVLYHPPVFLWLPHLLDDQKYLCPWSSCNNYKNPQKPLTIKGWNDDPIACHVVSLDGVYYVMTKVHPMP